MPEMTSADVARLREAVQFRDRCVRAALRDYSRLGFDGRDVHARSAFDSMSPLIEAGVRAQVAEELRAIAIDDDLLHQMIAGVMVEGAVTNGAVVRNVLLAVADAVPDEVARQHATEPVGQTEGQERTEGEGDG